MRTVLVILMILITKSNSNLYHECGKLFNPQQYLNKLPSLGLPYINQMKIPNNVVQQQIKATPVIPTKLISIVTTVLYQNPVCVKVSGRKKLCKSSKSNLEHIITKELFVNDRENRQLPLRKSIQDNTIFSAPIYVEGSEQPRPFSKPTKKTPNLLPQNINEILIEDRLDQLETILPNYKRHRNFQTSTITITKIMSNNRAMATLIVKNCIPQGFQLCPPKIKKRKSKVAQPTNKTSESHYFG